MFTWAKIAAGLISLANWATGWLTRNRDEQVGIDKKTLADVTAEVVADQAALKAANNTTAESVKASLKNGTF